MGVIKKQGIANTIISYLGIGLGYVNAVLLMPNLLQPDQLGLTRLLITIAVMYAQFSALGFGNMSLRFFPYFRDKEKHHHGFLFLLLGIPLLGFAVVTALFFVLKPLVVKYYADNSSLLLDYYVYIIPLAFFTLLFMLFDAYLRSLYKTVVSAFGQEFLNRILTTLSILVYATGLISFQEFVLLFIAVNSAAGLLLVVYAAWLKQLFIRPSVEALRRVPITEMLQYGAFAFMANMASTIVTTTDTLMIGAFLDLSQIAIYTTAFFITSAILVPAKSMYRVAYPQVADYWKRGDLKNMARLYKRVTLINLIIGLLLFLGIWCNRSNIYSFMPAGYSAGIYVVLFMGLARLFDVATGINAIIMVTSPKFRYDLFFNVLLSVLTVATNLYFIPRYGISGAAFASLISYVVFYLLRLAFVWYHFQMQPFAWSSVVILLIAAFSYLVNSFLPYLGNLYLDILVRSGLITVVFGSLVYFTRLSPDLNTSAQQILSRITGKGKS